jgi:hypothetical protein
MLNISKVALKHQLNLKFLFALQSLSMFALVFVMGVLRPIIVGSDQRPIQTNYHPTNSALFFIRTIYTFSEEQKQNLPAQLLFLPLTILLTGFIGLGFLYGWSCGNREESTTEIAWDAIKVQKKMNAIKELRINDMLDLLEGKEKEPEEEYSLKTETISMDMSAIESVRGEGQGRFREGIDKKKKKDEKDALLNKLQPVEDDAAKKLIEAQLGGRVINMNIDQERGQIIITFRGQARKITIIDVIFSRQMLFLWISFTCSGTIIIFYISKLSRTPMIYLLFESYNSAAIIAQGIFGASLILILILMMQWNKTKKFMLSNYTMMTYFLVLIYSTLSETFMGIMLTCASCLFIFVYMKVILEFIVAVSARKSKLFIYLYPAFYSVFISSNLLKVFIVDRYSDTSRSMIFTFLIIQAVGFLFMNGVDIEILQNKCFEYSAYEEMKEQEKGK